MKANVACRLGWKGICIEQNPAIFSQLQANRNCICIQGCVSDTKENSQFLLLPNGITGLCGLVDKYDPQHVQRIEHDLSRVTGSSEIIDVKCFLLNDLLEENEVEHIDFLSLDTEGGEFDIIASIDFSKYKIDVIALEDNYYDPRFIPFLEEKGYRLATRLEQDLIFVRRGYVE